MATSLTLGASGADVNPLLVESTAPHGAPQFTQITNEHYKPAFEQAVREARADIAAIVGNAQAPTFANTIEALEFSGRRLDRISNIFFNLNEAHTNDTMQALALELSPMLTEFSNDVSLDPKLFARVKAVYDRRESLGLNAEQRRLLEKTYKGFARSGAALSDGDKKIYRELTARLSELSLQFNQNSLAATNAFTLHVTDPAVVGELPDFVREGMAAEAKERGLDGWVVTLQIPSMVPFMTYSSNRALKEKLWRAYNTRCVAASSTTPPLSRKLPTSVCSLPVCLDTRHMPTTCWKSVWPRAPRRSTPFWRNCSTGLLRLRVAMWKPWPATPALRASTPS